MSTEHIRVSAVIPSFKRLDTLRRCLTALRISDYGFHEIIVVVRPNADEKTFSWLAGQMAMMDSLRLVPVEQAGQAVALNAGIEAAHGEFIAFFDDDVIPSPDWLTRVLAIMSKPDIGAVGGRDRIHIEGEMIEGAAQHAGERNWFGVVNGNHHLAYGPPREVDAVRGCNMLVRRQALGTLRFDTRLLGRGAQYRNDSWLCTNLKRAGWRIVFAPEADVDHLVTEDPKRKAQRYSAERCFIDTTNTVATDLAYASLWQKLKYGAYFLAVGHRYCPGLYYIAHAVFKRPWALGSMLNGGWSGYAAGLKLAKILHNKPPGAAVPLRSSSSAVTLTKIRPAHS